MTTIKLPGEFDIIAFSDVKRKENMTVNNVFPETGISTKYLISLLDRISEMISIEKVNEWRLEALIDYIISTHHKYAKESAALIHDLMHTVTYRHGKNHPEITRLATAMFLFLHDFLNHMMREEQILFPNITQLLRNKKSAGRAEYTTFGLIRECVTEMRQDHQSTIESLRLFHRLTDDYTLPTDACSSYKSLFEKLKEFEADFLLHSYLENNILFPKALIADGEIK